MPPPAAAPLVLKDEASVRVEVFGAGATAVVRKTYRNTGLRLLQSFGRRSRARREHDNLRRIQCAGIPCTEPVRWAERRAFGCVRESVLETRFLPDARTGKELLGSVLRSRWRERRRLITGMAGLVADLHRAGILWCTPMPRNVLAYGEPAFGRLAICDVPAAVPHRRSLHGSRIALLDLYDAAFSPSRRQDLSAPERLRWLLAYTAGSRDAARQLWHALARRSRRGHRLRKNLHMALWTYLLGLLRPAAP